MAHSRRHMPANAASYGAAAAAYGSAAAMYGAGGTTAPRRKSSTLLHSGTGTNTSDNAAVGSHEEWSGSRATRIGTKRASGNATRCGGATDSSHVDRCVGETKSSHPTSCEDGVDDTKNIAVASEALPCDSRVALSATKANTASGGLASGSDGTLGVMCAEEQGHVPQLDGHAAFADDAFVARELQGESLKRLGRQLQEQNHAFWQSSMRKDEEFASNTAALLAANSELEVLRDALHEETVRASSSAAEATAAEAAEAAAAEAKNKALEATRGELKTLRAELQEEKARSSRPPVGESSAGSDHQAREAEEERRLMKDELRSVRSDALQRIRKHTEDTEALSTQLLDARARHAQAESALASLRDGVHAEVRCRNEAIEEASVATRARHAAEAALSPSEGLAARECAIAEALRSELRAAKDLESTANASLARALHAEEIEAAAAQVAAESDRQASAVAAVAETEASNALVAAESSAEAAQAAARSQADEACALHTALRRAKEEASELEEIRREMSMARTNVRESESRYTRLSEELSRASRSRDLESQAAADAKKSLAHARIFEASAEEKIGEANRRGANLADELHALRVAETEQKRRWVFEMEESAEAEQANLAAAVAGARSATASAESVAKRAEAKAREEATARAALRNELRAESATFAQEHRALKDQLKELDMARAAEHQAALLARADAEEHAAHQVAQAVAEVADALAAAASARGAEDSAKADLASELTACASLKRQATAAREKLLRYQEVVETRLEQDAEREQELAKARADATRHACSATELRAELADVRQQLSKQRIAARDLEKLVDDLNAARVRGGHTMRLEKELGISRARQAFLEKQLKENQQSLAAERGVAYSFGGSESSLNPYPTFETLGLASSNVAVCAYAAPDTPGSLPTSTTSGLHRCAGNPLGSALGQHSHDVSRHLDDFSTARLGELMVPRGKSPDHTGKVFARNSSAEQVYTSSFFTSSTMARSQSLGALTPTGGSLGTLRCGDRISARSWGDDEFAGSSSSGRLVGGRRELAPLHPQPPLQFPAASVDEDSGTDARARSLASPTGHVAPPLPPRPPPACSSRMGWVASGAASAAAAARNVDT